MRTGFIACFFLLLILFIPQVHAESNYVLPYPQAMPGSKFYVLDKIQETLLKYYSFGNLSKITYHRSFSDKYLVEAKTLFEYKQYLLATEAITKSNNHFQEQNTYMMSAKKEGKDISEVKDTLHSQIEKHIEVLELLIVSTPQEFNWTSEIGSASKLFIHKLLNDSIRIRDL